MNKTRLVISVAVVCLALAAVAPAAIIVDNGSLVYTQDWNTAALTWPNNAENVLPWTNNLTVAGWYNTSADNLISVNMGGTGSDITSYGAQSTNIDRAIGWRLPGASSPSAFGLAAVFANATGKTIQEIRVTYRGEQYRVITNQPARTMGLYYKIGGDFVGMHLLPISNVWTEVSSLQWTTPKYDTYATANLNGNLAGNYADVSNSFSVTWNDGTELWLGFHANQTGTTSHSVGVDDIVVTFVRAAPPPSGAMMLIR